MNPLKLSCIIVAFTSSLGMAAPKVTAPKVEVGRPDMPVTQAAVDPLSGAPVVHVTGAEPRPALSEVAQKQAELKTGGRRAP